MTIRVNVFRVTGPRGLGLMLEGAFTGSALSVVSEIQRGLGALQHNTNTRCPDQSMDSTFLLSASPKTAWLWIRYQSKLAKCWSGVSQILLIPADSKSEQTSNFHVLMSVRRVSNLSIRSKQIQFRCLSTRDIPADLTESFVRKR